MFAHIKALSWSTSAREKLEICCGGSGDELLRPVGVFLARELSLTLGIEGRKRICACGGSLQKG
jgi:hypothetical protein